MATNQQIIDCMDLLSGSFPNQKISAQMARSYKLGLEDLDGNLIIRAAANIVKDEKRSNNFFPSIKEIRTVALRLKAGDEAYPVCSPLDAWELKRQQLFYEFWALHPGDYAGFDGDFQRFALERMPANLVRLDTKC